MSFRKWMLGFLCIAVAGTCCPAALAAENGDVPDQGRVQGQPPATKPTEPEPKGAKEPAAPKSVQTRTRSTGPVEIEVEPIHAEPATGQGRLSQEGGSQAGVQLRFRLRKKTTLDAEKDAVAEKNAAAEQQR